MTTTIAALAGDIAAMFETRTRDNGDTFIAFKESAPDWTAEFIQTAHGTDIFPDDWRYRAVFEACEFIAERFDDEDADDIHSSDDAHEFADDVDVYTSDLTNWLASHNSRQGYCDQAADEGFVSAGADISQRLMAGQYLERREIFAQTLEALQNRLDEIETAETLEALAE